MLLNFVTDHLRHLHHGDVGDGSLSFTGAHSHLHHLHQGAGGGGFLLASTTLMASLAISSIPRPVIAEHSK